MENKWGWEYNGEESLGFEEIGFTGYRYDSESGLYHAPFREYDPMTASWTTSDPIKDGMLWYGFVESNPLRYVDPLGLEHKCLETLINEWDFFKSGGYSEDTGLVDGELFIDINDYAAAAEYKMYIKLVNADWYRLDQTIINNVGMFVYGSIVFFAPDTYDQLIGGMLVYDIISPFQPLIEGVAAKLQASAGAALERLYTRLWGSKIDDVVSNPQLWDDVGNKSLFESFSVNPGKDIDLVNPSGENGRSYITYGLFDESYNITYIGRASGNGNPIQVLKQRIAKGHDHINSELVARVLDVHKTKLASQGAEEFYIQGFLEQGAALTNAEESLSFSRASRIVSSINKLETYFEELFIKKGW